MGSLESTINGRFQIIPAGNIPAPGSCCCCGSVQRDVVDFGLTIDFYGGVFICTECMAEATKTLGTASETLVVPPSFEFLDAGAVHEYLSATLDVTRRLISLLPDTDFDDLSVPTDDEAKSEVSGKSDSGSNGSSENSSGTDNAISEPFGF